MHSLASPVESNIDGIGLDLSFDKVLTVLKLQKEQLFTEAEKRDIALSLLLRAPKKINIYSADQRNELLRRVFDECIFTERKKSPGGNEKIFDFEQDAGFIYASFMQAYGIDLIEQQGKLHWQKFITLFRGLPENTKIREVMGIRSRKTPKPTKYNGEEIKAMTEAKAYYKLEVDEAEAEVNFQQGIDRLAASLMQRTGG